MISNKKEDTIINFMETLETTKNFWINKLSKLEGYRFVISGHDEYRCNFHILFYLYNVPYGVTFEMTDKKEWEVRVLSTRHDMASILCSAIKSELEDLK